MRRLAGWNLPPLFLSERDDPIRAAGGKVLCGALSLALATAFAQGSPVVTSAAQAKPELLSPKEEGHAIGELAAHQDDPHGEDETESLGDESQDDRDPSDDNTESAGHGGEDVDLKDDKSDGVDDEDVNEKGESEDEAPLIAEVTSARDQDSTMPVEDEGLYASVLDVSLARPVVLDTEKCEVRLCVKDDDPEHPSLVVRPVRVVTCEPPVEDAGDEEDTDLGEVEGDHVVGGSEDEQDSVGNDADDVVYANALVFDVPDGDYERLTVVVQELSKEDAEQVSFSRVSFDRTAPHFEAWHAGSPLVDGSVLSEGSSVLVRAEEPHPLLDEAGRPIFETLLTDVTDGRMLALENWSVADAPATYEQMVRAEDMTLLDDGSYRLQMGGRDALGNEAQDAVWSFSVDSAPPVIVVALPDNEPAAMHDGKLFFHEPTNVTVTISDAHLNEQDTFVCGVSLEELLGIADNDEREFREGVTCGSWQVSEGSKGAMTYRACVRLSEGALALSDLAQAVDELGHESSATFSYEGEQIHDLMVDTSAPLVQAAVSDVPARVWSDMHTSDEYAFFDAQASLRFTFSDWSGIQSVHLEGSEVYTDERLQTYDDMSGATIDLGEDAFNANVRLVVTDWAGNHTVWSLRPMGEKRDAGGVVPTENAPLETPDSKVLVGAQGHPYALVVDTVSPDVSLVAAQEGSVSADSFVARVRVSDLNMPLLARLDPRQVVASVTCDDTVITTLAVASDHALGAGTVREYLIPIVASEGHETDGKYAITVCVTDLAGNVSDRLTRTFVIDTTPPVLDVSFDDEKTDNQPLGEKYFSKPRTAHVSLTERNLTAEDLNGNDTPVNIAAHARDGRNASEVSIGSWSFDESARCFRCLVSFPADGTFSLEIVGGDKANNLMVGQGNTVVDAEGRYVSNEFIIDSAKPTIVMGYSPKAPKPHTYGGVDYFNAPVPVDVTVTDRNFDSVNSKMLDSRGELVVPTWASSSRADNGEVMSTATHTYVEEESGGSYQQKHVEVQARDLAGNESVAAMRPFVVDQTAPSIERVTLSKAPTTQGEVSGEDPLWFFNERDGIATIMTFEVRDEYLLDEVWVSDPDGVYDVQADNVRGHERATLELSLKDYAVEGEGRNTDFERNVVLSVRDVAGNLRTWTIDRHGTVVADKEASTANVSLFDGGVFPQMLIKDTTAPRVEVSGVQEGAYYAESQTAHVALSEHNFDYLKRFDANRVVATVRRREPSANGESTSWVVSASQLEGERPNYSYDQPFVTDGHYDITVQAEDFAGNRSEAVETGEFTIDKTAPRIDVSWDNTDMRNGMYYNAPRVATITVTEHNFDARLFSIAATGTVGGWISQGDEHACSVTFSEDADAQTPHTLVVRGKDLAGNEAIPYEEPPFCIDTQAPVVAIKRQVSTSNPFLVESDVEDLTNQSAFAEALMPLVAFEDEAALDERSLEIAIEGCRDGNAQPAWLQERRASEDARRLTVDWGNIGFTQEGGDPSYRLDADDVYTISAKAVDLAGNESEQHEVSFSVNRYGSNFFVEDLNGGDELLSDAMALVPMASAPRIVVHEVNVSGAVSELDPEALGDAQGVTKEHASATLPIERTPQEEGYGYTLQSSTSVTEHNPYEGWSEYTYVVSPGNFGKGSDSDYGDGGQGSYRVNVSSHDRARNNNTTSRYWGSNPTRASSVEDKSATVSFILDEFGPQIEDLNLPKGLVVGNDFEASFRLHDEITNGDHITVRVDGEEVNVFRAGSSEPLATDETIGRQGVFTFSIPAKPLIEERSVEISVSDYTGSDARKTSTRIEGFRVSTLVSEALAIVGSVGVALVARLITRRGRSIFK